MITIRSEQMQVFEFDAVSQFKRRLRLHLSATLAPDVDVDRLIERALSDAPTFYLTAEKDVARFGEITGRVLGRFPDENLPVPALAILKSYGMQASEKLDRYLAWALEEQHA